MFVPVVDQNQKPLMPTTPSRAARWVRSGKASPFWKKGVWCVRLNQEPSGRNTQPIALGIDPGSKREGFTVKSESHTYLNIHAHAVDGNRIKKKLEARRNLRRSRRNRNTPCRQPRWSNRRQPKLAPSTKARWQWKLRITDWLCKMFPIEAAVVEDIKAKTFRGKGGRWNKSFSPLQVGKQWLYSELRKRFKYLETPQGFETKQWRNEQGLRKTGKKLAEVFEAHCVDSWVLANSWVGGHIKPDNTELIIVQPLTSHRRQLHVQNFSKGGIRKQYGSTRSLGFERGSIVIHPKHGECLVGGTSKERVSLTDRKTGKRLTQCARPEDIRFRSFNSFLVRG